MVIGMVVIIVVASAVLFRSGFGHGNRCGCGGSHICSHC